MHQILVRSQLSYTFGFPKICLTYLIIMKASCIKDESYKIFVYSNEGVGGKMRGEVVVLSYKETLLHKIT